MMATQTIPRGIKIRLTDCEQAHARFIKELCGWIALHQQPQIWLELQIGARLLTNDTIIRQVKVTARDVEGQLWRAHVQCVHPERPGCWRLTGWRHLARTDIDYKPGITISLGFHRKHLTQLR